MHENNVDTGKASDWREVGVKLQTVPPKHDVLNNLDEKKTGK